MDTWVGGRLGGRWRRVDVGVGGRLHERGRDTRCMNRRVCGLGDGWVRGFGGVDERWMSVAFPELQLWVSCPVGGEVFGGSHT